MKKKLAVLCAQVLVFSCLAGCEQAPYCPTAWDVLTDALPRLAKITDVELHVELTITYNGKEWKLQ